MAQTVYTAVTFSPVQEFIEKSRKLRDLYGSSFLLSYLSSTICWEAQCQGAEVISPALINVIQGTPNHIILGKEFSPEAIENALEVFETTSEEEAIAKCLESFKNALETAFNYKWQQITDRCRTWIEEQCQTEIETQRQNWATPDKWNKDVAALPWTRDWELWTNHAWEFFGAHGYSISAARAALTELKHQRNWIAPNWTGESSTLSGADAVSYPGMSRINPKQFDYDQEKTAVKSFYQLLSEKVGEAFLKHIAEQLHQNKSPEFPKQLVEKYGTGFLEFVRRILPNPNSKVPQEFALKYGGAIIDPDEQLSIPELVKRLVTLEAIAQPIGIPAGEIPESFRDLNRLNTKDTKEKKEKEKQQPPESEPDNRWTGWFRGDGDNVGNHLRKLKEQGEKEDKALKGFSRAMMHWGEKCLKLSLPEGKGKIIYAGGDDFLGVFYRTPPKQEYLDPLVRYLKAQVAGEISEPKDNIALDMVIAKGLHKDVKLSDNLCQTLADAIKCHKGDSTLQGHLKHAGLKHEEAITLFQKPVLTADECLQWFYEFRSTADKPDLDNCQTSTDLWSRHCKPITASIGFVWAAPNVPQRDVLQHCQEAEQIAKRKGRDRLCIRILFNSGNFLEWTCPWWFLNVLQDYRDRDDNKNWTHIYNDVAILESRHAFQKQTDVALTLFEVYFGKPRRNELWQHCWDNEEKTGILGNKAAPNDSSNIKALNRWIINLAKVGFHLCQQ